MATDSQGNIVLGTPLSATATKSPVASSSNTDSQGNIVLGTPAKVAPAPTPVAPTTTSKSPFNPLTPNSQFVKPGSPEPGTSTKSQFLPALGDTVAAPFEQAGQEQQTLLNTPAAISKYQQDQQTAKDQAGQKALNISIGPSQSDISTLNQKGAALTASQQFLNSNRPTATSTKQQVKDYNTQVAQHNSNIDDYNILNTKVNGQQSSENSVFSKAAAYNAGNTKVQSEVTGESPTALSFDQTLANSTIVGQLNNLVKNTPGQNENNKQATADFAQAHPGLSAVAHVLGGVTDLIMTNALVAPLGIADATTSGVKSALGGLQYANPTPFEAFDAAGVAKSAGNMAQSGSLFAAQSLLSTGLQQAQDQKFDPAALAKNAASAFAMGAAMGTGTGFVARGTRGAVSALATGAMSTTEKLISNGKLTAKDWVDIGVNATVAGLFSAFTGDTPGDVKDQRTQELAFDNQIAQYRNADPSLSYEQGKQAAGLQNALAYARITGQGVTPELIQRGVEGLLYQDVKPTTEMKLILSDIPESFKTLPPEQRVQIMENVSEKVSAGETMPQAISEATADLPDAKAPTLKGFVPPAGSPSFQMAKANGNVASHFTPPTQLPVDLMKGIEPTENISNQQKVINAFNKSTSQKPIATLGTTKFELGSFGNNQANSKMGQVDRFPASELKTTIDNITNSYKASNNPNNYRSQNIAWVAKMPNGEQRVIYTRQNANGAEEIINWHKVDLQKNPKYLSTLESFGSPAGNRTQISPLEGEKSNPLTYGTDKSISQAGNNINFFKPPTSLPADQLRQEFAATHTLEVKTPAETSKIQSGEAITAVAKASYDKPLLSKTAVATLLRNVPEFKANPTLTVVTHNDSPALEFQGKSARFLIKPSALGLVEANLKPGQKINVKTEDFLKPNKEKTNVRVVEQKGPESIMLAAGFNPGVDKFIEEDVKPALEQTAIAVKTVLTFVQKLTDALINIVDRGAVVSKRVGAEAYSQIIKAIHLPEAEMVTYDENFKQSEKYFNNFSTKDLSNFNLAWGSPRTEPGQAVQKEAYSKLPPALKDKSLIDKIQKASDFVFKYATDHDIPIEYFQEYFYGVYKADPGIVRTFLDHWQTTDKFTKEKVFPTPADAYAFDNRLVLRDQNPITNRGSELKAVAHLVGMQNLKDWLITQPNIAVTGKVNGIATAKWLPIEDQVFKGMLFQPDFAKMVNNLIATNKVSKSFVFKAFRQIAFFGQRIKFFGSIVHQITIGKAVIADAPFGIVDPRAVVRIGKSFVSINTKEPQYKEYISLGGGHKYSLESQALQSQFMKGIDQLMRGNYIGGLIRTSVGGAYTVSKVIPGSPAYVKWLFDSSIPAIKYNAWKVKVAAKEASLGRPLTDAEKIDILRENQNFYGEMNERLFGRSGTATSAMRIIFNSPGFFEGNFRTVLNVLFGKGLNGRAKNVMFILYSFLTLIIAAEIGTRLMTGKWRKLPTDKKDYRDLAKIDTGQKDGNGNPVMIDLASYERDYMSVYFNAATGQLGKIPQDLSSRLTGIYSTPFKISTDIQAILEGKIVVDWKGAPIYFRTDSIQQKFAKFMTYEATQGQPISLGNLTTGQQKGLGLLQDIAGAESGFTPTSTEAVKELNSIRQDFFSLQDARTQKQIQLSPLNKTNPAEALKQMKAFNAAQKAEQATMKQKVDDLVKRGVDPAVVKKYFPYGVTDAKYTQLSRP